MVEPVAYQLFIFSYLNSTQQHMTIDYSRWFLITEQHNENCAFIRSSSSASSINGQYYSYVLAVNAGTKRLSDDWYTAMILRVWSVVGLVIQQNKPFKILDEVRWRILATRGSVQWRTCLRITGVVADSEWKITLGARIYGNIQVGLYQPCVMLQIAMEIGLVYQIYLNDKVELGKGFTGSNRPHTRPKIYSHTRRFQV